MLLEVDKLVSIIRFSSMDIGFSTYKSLLFPYGGVTFHALNN
jgi:hypothetical protein